MKRPILLATLVAALLPLSGHSDTDKGSEEDKRVVILTIDYGDGAQKRYPEIPWKQNMTVLDATQWAVRHPRGVKIAKRGTGSFTLVTQIDDLKNGGNDAKNWIFRVNDKLGDRSCGVAKVGSGDRILWKFERYK